MNETTPPAPSLAVRAAAWLLLVVSLALLVYAAQTALQFEPVREPSAITLLTDPKELTAHGHDVVGTFATGNQEGDRVIAVTADGRVTFSEIGGTRDADRDTYRLGRRGKIICLATAASGVIECTNLDTLVYYGDTYQRR